MISGGREALASWGGDPDAPRNTWPSHVPEPDMAFLRGLALWHQVGGYFFAHAGIRPGVALDESIDWGTTRFVRAADLPSSRESAALTSDLFPGGLAPEADPAAPHAAEPTPAKPHRAEKDSGPVRFRMSTRQTSAPDPLESAPAALPPP
jgi:hypothetical protein